jgi:hypothetical protein
MLMSARTSIVCMRMHDCRSSCICIVETVSFNEEFQPADIMPKIAVAHPRVDGILFLTNGFRKVPCARE